MTNDARPPDAGPRPEDARTPEERSTDYTVAFSPRQIGGFVVIAALIAAVARWLRGRGRA